MPLYEYICETCGHSFEKLQSFSEADRPQACPACGSHQARRKLSAFAVSGGSSRPQVVARPPRSPFT